MLKLNIYTEELFWRYKVKVLLKRLLGRLDRGPRAVFRSLTAGLSQLGVNFTVNKVPRGVVDVACVLTGAKTLAWAIKQKQDGKIKKIIAGPDVGMPKDGLIYNPNIDIFVVPSKWVAEFCNSFSQGFLKKVRIWAAGVQTLPENELKKKRKGLLIYQKNVPTEIRTFIKEELKKRGIAYNVLIYGQYQKAKYLNMLKGAQGLIFLSNSESQGLALNEAWMCNAPTLVYSGGHLKTAEYEWQNSSPAPYLNEQCGMFFSGKDNFSQRLDEFLQKLPHFKPRQYHLNNFTDRVCAQKYLEIVKEAA